MKMPRLGRVPGELRDALSDLDFIVVEDPDLSHSATGCLVGYRRSVLAVDAQESDVHLVEYTFNVDGKSHTLGHIMYTDHDVEVQPQVYVDNDIVKLRLYNITDDETITEHTYSRTRDD